MEKLTISVKNYPIRLGQFLKLAEVVQDGFEAKYVIQHSEVKVNGQVELKRGKKLIKGDCVQIRESVLLTLR